MSARREWRERRFPDAAFAKSPAGRIPQQLIPVDQVGHFVSAVFAVGLRSYMFHGAENRDRFVKLYASVGAEPLEEDPVP